MTTTLMRLFEASRVVPGACMVKARAPGLCTPCTVEVLRWWLWPASTPPPPRRLQSTGRRARGREKATNDNADEWPTASDNKAGAEKVRQQRVLILPGFACRVMHPTKLIHEPKFFSMDLSNNSGAKPDHIFGVHRAFRGEVTVTWMCLFLMESLNYTYSHTYTKAHIYIPRGTHKYVHIHLYTYDW